MTPAEKLDGTTVTLLRWDPVLIDQLDAAITASLPDLELFMPWAADHTPEKSRAFVYRSVSEWDSGETWNYAMLDSTGELVGSCGLMTRMGPGVLEIGYWVHSAHAGRGYATDATNTLVQAGFRKPGVNRIAIRHDRGNPGSGRVAAKAGFTRIRESEAEVQAPGQTGVEVLWELHRPIASQA